MNKSKMFAAAVFVTALLVSGGRVLAAAPVFVQGTTGSAFSAKSVSVTFSKNVTAGDVIAFGVGWGSSTATLTSVTSTCASSLVLLNNPTNYGTSERAAQGYAVVGTSGACSVTASFSALISGSSFELIEELSGVSTSSPLDVSAMQHQDAPGTGANAVTSGNITTTAIGDYLIGIGVDGGSNGIMWTPGTGYLTNIPPANDMASEGQVRTVAGTVAATFTITPGFAHPTVGIMAFKTVPSISTVITAPTLATATTTSITATGATLNGSITGAGGANATQSGFSYGTDPTFATAIATTTLGGQIGLAPFSSAVTGLACNTTYYARAYAINSAGTGYGSVQSFTTLSCMPGAPTNGYGIAGNGSAIVSFLAPASVGGSAITNYTVTSNPGNSIATGSASPITVSGLANGTAYNFTVTATNSFGSGPASINSNMVTPGTNTVIKIPTDIYVNMEAGNDGDLLTPALVNASIIGGGGTWTAGDTSASFFVSNAAAQTVPVPVQLNGTGATYTDPGTRGWRFDSSVAGSGVVTFTPATPLAQFSIGSFLSFGVPQGYNGYVDYVGIRNFPAGVAVNYTTSAGSSVVRTEGRVAGVSTLGTNINVIPGKVYWIFVHFNSTSTNSNTSLFVYDPTTWTLLGSSTAPMDNGDPATSIDFGAQNSSAEKGPWNSYWDDILMNWTQPQFPLVPDPIAPAITSFVMPGSASSTTVPVTTLAATDNVGVAGYIITESSSIPASSNPGWTASAPTSFTFAGSGTRTAYAWTEDAVGNISPSAHQAVIVSASSTGNPTSTPDLIAPSIPANLFATGTSANQITLSWTASTDNVGVAGYQIFRNGAQVGTTTAVTYQDTGLTASTAYSYAVTAFDAAGNISASSSPAIGTTLANSDITPPTVQIASPANGAIVSSTTLISGTSSDDVLVSSVQLSIDGGVFAPAVGTSTWNFLWNTVPVTNGSHTITALATDSSGNIASTTISVTVSNPDRQAPSVPMGLTAGTVTTSTVTFSWTASTDNVGVAGYQIFRNGAQVGTTTAATSFTDTGLATSTAYSYTVSAFDAAGNISSSSAPLNITTATGITKVVVPAFVQGVTARSYSAKSISLAFTKSVTAGDVIAFGVDWGSSTITLNSVSSSCATAPVILNNPTAYGTTGRAAQGYVVITSSGACTVNASLSASVGSGGVSLLIEELSGVSTSSPLDISAMQNLNAPGTGANAATSGKVTTTQNGDYLVGIGVDSSANGIVWTPGTGYTMQVAGANEMTSEGQVQTTAGSATATFTITPAYAHPTVGIMAFEAGQAH